MSRRGLLKLFVVAVAAALAASCTPSAANVGEELVVYDVSGRMPALDGTAIRGGTVGPPTYRDRPVVVNFWASWCWQCRREQAALNQAHAAAGPDGPVFIGVDWMDPDRAAASAFLEEFGVRYPSIRDPSGSIAYRFDVPYLPATVFIDASGQMRFRAVGALTRSRLESLIARISSPGATPTA